MGKYLIFLLVLLSWAQSQAQSAGYGPSCGFSEGKSLSQLSRAVFEKPQGPLFNRFQLSDKIRGGQSGLEQAVAQTPSNVLLPKWSADNLPFFCKIEHDWGKNARLPFKFRLGSVEYVDWLEGKHP